MAIIIAAIILGLVQILGFVGLSWLIRLYVERKQAEIEDRISEVLHAWADQPEPDKPSKLALVLDAVGSTVGSAAARSIMATLSASDSHAARAANSASEVLEAQRNPIMSLLTGAKRGKGAAVMRLAEMLGPMLGGAVAPREPGNNGGSAYAGRKHHD